MENVLGKAIDPRSLFGGSKNKKSNKEQKADREVKPSKSSSKTSASSPKAPKGGEKTKEKSTSSKQNMGSSSKSILDEDLEAELGGSSPKVIDSKSEDSVREKIPVPSSNKRPYSDGTPIEALQNLAIGGKSSSDASIIPPSGNPNKKSKSETGVGASAEALGIDNPPRSFADSSPQKTASSLHEELKDGSPSKVDPMGNLLQATFTSSETDMPKGRNASKERDIEELFESGQNFLFQAGQDLIELKTFAEREINYRAAISQELEEKKTEFDRVFAEKLALEREKSARESGEEVHRQLSEELEKLKSLHEQDKQEFIRREKEAFDRGYKDGYEARSAELRKILSDNKLL